MLSEDDYLAGELQSEVGHEYVAGSVYAMVAVQRNITASRSRWPRA